MNPFQIRVFVLLAGSLLLAGTAPAAAAAQDADTEAKRLAAASPEYRQHVAATVTDENWRAVE
jgi:hypothetical protein